MCAFTLLKRFWFIRILTEIFGREETIRIENKMEKTMSLNE